MAIKKRAIILIAIAIILLITSFTLMASDSPIEVTKKNTEDTQGSGKVGIDIVPSEIEDKLVEENGK